MQHLAQPFDVFSPAFDADPYPAYRRLREDHPLLWHEPTASYVISRYEDVRTAFTDPRFTSDNYRWQLEPVHGRTILQMDGREHAVTRALVAPAFRGTALKEHVIPLIEKNAVALIDGFRGTGHADLVAQFAVHFPSMSSPTCSVWPLQIVRHCTAGTPQSSPSSATLPKIPRWLPTGCAHAPSSALTCSRSSANADRTPAATSSPLSARLRWTGRT